MVSAFTSGAILQIVFVSILFGVALAMLGEKGERLQASLKTLTAIVFRIVHMLMVLAPLAAFGAMAFTIGKYGIGALANLAALIATFYATSLLFVIVVLGLIARAAGFSLWGLVRYIKDELFLVLGTSSSESALPLLMEKLERAGCPKPIVGLVVPTGYSFNLDGTCIYMSLAALFIAQACNIPLSAEEQLWLMAVAIVSSKGAAGVTGSGFVTLAATLSMVPSIPVAGMALILGIDRFMSECRSADQLHRQCGRDDRRRPLGGRGRPRPASRRLPRRGRRLHRKRKRRAADRGQERRHEGGGKGMKLVIGIRGRRGRRHCLRVGDRGRRPPRLSDAARHRLRRPGQLLAAYFETVPLGGKLSILGAWFVGALAGAWVANAIAGRSLAGWIVALLVIAGGIVTMTDDPASGLAVGRRDRAAADRRRLARKLTGPAVAADVQSPP